MQRTVSCELKCSHLILIPKTQDNGPWNTMVFAVKCFELQDDPNP